jgi:hypothetical protein
MSEKSLTPHLSFSMLRTMIMTLEAIIICEEG